MITKRIIPCLDVKNGEVVKGVKFAGLQSQGDPAELALRYEEQGADEIVMLDVSATLEGRKATLSTVREVRRALSIPLSVGGGIRSVDSAAELLSAGADKICVNSAACRRPELVSELALTFGRQCTVVAVDARRTANSWEVLIESGRTTTGMNVPDWLAKVEEFGAGEVLLTSWDRDGTREGYDVELLAAARSACTLPLIASGGANNPGDLEEAFQWGADAALAASLFHQQDYSVREVKQYLEQKGVSVRL